MEEIERKIKKSVWDMAWKLLEASITTAYAVKEIEPNVSAFINWGLEFLKSTTEVGVEAAGTLEHEKSAKAEKLAGSSTPAGRVHLTQSYAFDLWGIYQIDENQGNIANMEDYASIALRSARGALKAHVKHLFNGSLDVITAKRTPALTFLMTADAQRALMESEENTAREE
jgi:hypothetical protein